MFLYLMIICRFINMKCIAAVFVSTILLFNTVKGQSTFNQAKMDSLLTIYEQKNKLMLTMAIRKDGNVIYKRATGYSLIMEEGAIKSTPSSKYRIGSITKTFTAVMIMQLVEEKKLKLTTPLSKFYPKFLKAKSITIEHLLMHRSGIHNFTEDEDFFSYKNAPKSHEEMMDIFAKLPSDFEPGSKYSYSNTNYVLLGYIIEKLRKRSYEEVLRAYITDKLGLNDTYYGKKPDPLNNECKSFMFDGKEWKPSDETDMSIPAGAGAIVSTAEDVTRFIDAIFNYSLLKKETVDLMSQQKEGYGMGIFTLPFYDKIAIGHTGQIDYFTSHMFYFADDKVAIGVSANGVNTDINEFLIGALSILFNKPYELPRFYSVEVPENVLMDYAGVYYNESMQLSFYVTQEGNFIVGQAEGQSSFPLEAKTQNIFTYVPANIELEFLRNENNDVYEFVLKQNGMEFMFKKLK